MFVQNGFLMSYKFNKKMCLLLSLFIQLHNLVAGMLELLQLLSGGCEVKATAVVPLSTIITITIKTTTNIIIVIVVVSRRRIAGNCNGDHLEVFLQLQL